MKVNNVNNKAIQSLNTGNTSSLDKALQSKNKSTTGDADKVESSKLNLSAKAQMMQKAKNIASDQSVDEAKVARLQKMIDEGSYKVDAKAVADRLVDSHLLYND